MAAMPSDNAVYKQLSEEMRDGLKNIYEKTIVDKQSKPTDALFTEASGELDEVVKTTEAATMNIMEIVEKRQILADESGQLLGALKQKLGDDPALLRLEEINAGLNEDLITLLTTLSFQDITGQRIKKVMGALAAIEKSVLELYLTSGLIMEAAEKEPTKNAETIKAEAQKAVADFKSRGSELKGPDKNAPSQEAIDNMLAELGL